MTPATAASCCGAARRPQINICCYPVGSGEITAYPEEQGVAGRSPSRGHAQGAGRCAAGPVEPLRRSRVKGDRGDGRAQRQAIIDSAQLTGIAGRGPIGLQHHGEHGRGVRQHLRPRTVDADQVARRNPFAAAHVRLRSGGNRLARGAGGNRDAKKKLSHHRAGRSRGRRRTKPAAPCRGG